MIKECKWKNKEFLAKWIKYNKGEKKRQKRFEENKIEKEMEFEVVDLKLQSSASGADMEQAKPRL